LQEEALASSRPEDVELRLDLERSIEALPETYREAILLFYYGDLSVAETAARLGIMPEAARVRLHRGRALIRDRLVGRRRQGGLMTLP
jgi:RNA polymerase sigma-70 factor (ECF subfamily)